MRMSLVDSAAFYTLLAMSATDLDIRRDTGKSPMAIRYFATALSMTNKRLAKLVGPPTDAMIAEVAMYITYEVSLFLICQRFTDINRPCSARLKDLLRI